MTNSDISGQITDALGNPIASAEVYLWREDLAGAGGVVAVTTADSSGNFSFTSHPDGSGSSESWHIAAKDPNANVQLQSAYGVTASLPTPVNSQFDVSITGTSPSPVAPGETLTVDASLTNSGTDQDTQTVTLDINNSVGQVDSTSVTLSGGGSTTQTLSWAVPSGQTKQDYQATVASADDSASQTVTVGSGPTAIEQNADNYWFFDEGSGTTVADANGSLTASFADITSWESGLGAKDNYVSLDGDNDEADLGSASQSAFSHFINNGEGAVGMWAKIDDTSAQSHLFTSGVIGGELGYRAFWNASGGYLQFRGYNGSSSVFKAEGGSLTPGEWHSLVFTADGSNARIYVDGTEVASDTISGTTSGDLTRNVVLAGTNGQLPQEPWGGDFDNAFHSSTGFTATEVQNWHDAFKDKYSGSSGTSPDTLYTSTTLGTNSDTAILTDVALDDTGNYAIGGGGVSVVDVSDPVNPTEVGYLNESTAGSNYGIEAKGGYAFGAGFGGTFTVVDFNANQSPSNPQVVATLDYTSGEGLRKPTIDGNYLYLSSEQPGDEFYSVDITDPTAPTKADTVTQSSLDRDFEVEIVGNTALICARPSGVLVQIDVSDPNNMSALGTYSDPNFVGPYGITADGSGTAYVVDGDGDNVIALDVTDPTNISTLGTVAPTNLNHPYGNDVYGPNNEYLVVACRGENTSSSSDEYFVTIDVSDPSNMTAVGNVSVGNGYGPYDVVHGGNEYAYGVSRGQGVFDVIGDAT